MAKVDKRYNNGRTNYREKYNKTKVKEHILTPEEQQAMIDDYLKKNTIKVYDNGGNNIIEEKTKWKQ